MTQDEVLFYIIMPAILLVALALYFVMRRDFKKSDEDWKQMNDLERRAYLVESKEEIELLYNQILDFNKSINNRFITIKADKVCSYLDGVYKQYNIKSDKN
jgi:hypothetical protein